MNFKPNMWKIIVSILVIIIVDIFLSSSTQGVCMMEMGGTCAQPFWYEHIFDSGAVLVSLIVGLIVYVIWSLFEKKKRKR